MNKYLSFLILFFFELKTYSQVNRYMVFFSDKNNSPYSINNPQVFLSERSIDRRNKHETQIDITDLPVNQEYITGVDSLGAEVFYNTKWMNGTLIQCADTVLNKLLSLPFVTRIEYVAPGPRPVTITESGKKSNNNRERTMELSNAIQNNMLGVERMHSQNIHGEGVLIAVLDAGYIGLESSVFFNHLFTNNMIRGQRNFVTGSDNVFELDSHGTEVLSCMAAYKNGEYEGVAYNSSFILCITEDVPTEYRIEEYNWLFGAEYADSLGADIINSSVGYNLFDDSTMNYHYSSMDGNTAVTTRAADLAASKGILCVVSAGNEGNNSWKKIVAPADGDSVIAVGAVNSSMQRTYFSSQGPSADGRIKPEVCALGYMTSIVGSKNQVGFGDGTSYSTPLISGLAAGIWQEFPDLSNMELIEVIEKGSSQYLNPDMLMGYGIPDFNKIQLLITSFSEELPENIFKVYPNPVRQKKLFVEYNSKIRNQSLNIEIYNMAGKSCFMENDLLNKINNKIELDLSNLQSGIYILYLNAAAGKGKVKLLIP